MRVSSVVSERGVGGLVFKITKVFHVPLSNAAAGFSYIGGCAFGAVITSDFINNIFNVALTCQPCFACVTCATARGAGWWVEG